MNKITHEGNDYEVLTLDRISEITHARLANLESPLVAEYNDRSQVGFIRWEYSDCRCGTAWVDCLQSLGIQPLKLLEKVPVEFTDTFAQCVDGKWYPVYSLDDGFGYQRCEQKVFRCVEVTK